METENADIVVVDDNTDNLRILVSILKRKGYQARPATSGALALDAIFAKPPALILLDIMMPEMDGLELCRRLKAAPEVRDIPVIFITALEELEEKLKAFAAGGADYITKPFQELEVLARIETHLALFTAKEALKRQEAQNQKIMKAQSLMRMAGAIAHKFNNHLQAVMGNIEMTAALWPKTEKKPKTLEAAMASAGRAAEISKMMLTYTGKAAGKHEIMDLSASCSMSLPLFQATLPQNITLSTDIQSPGPRIKANEAQIQQMITQLVTNAHESMNKQPGSVHLAVKTVFSDQIPKTFRFPVEWEPAATSYACLEVSDSGCGISGKNMEEIFDPFFSTNFTGRGLGLPVVLGIANAHHGGITVESSLEKGSTFRVFLPLATEAAGAATGAAPEGVRPAAGTVLVAEAEKEVRRLIAAFLKEQGCHVLEAADGIEAEAVFRSHQNEIQCVLTDLTMPGKNGWETIEALRRISPKIYIILSSGYDEAHVMAGQHTEKPQVFLRKPYNLQDLLNAIQGSDPGGNA